MLRKALCPILIFIIIFFVFLSELWRKENNVQTNLSSLKEDLAKADQQLRSMVGKPILNGRDSIRKVLDTFICKYLQYSKLYYKMYNMYI